MPAEAVLRCMDLLLKKMIDRKRAERYCSEDISEIENYEQAVNDKTQTWHCHHKLEIQGQFQNSPALLKRCGLYYHVPAWQLIFLTRSEHTRLHKLGNHHSEESRKKMSIALKGKFCGERNHRFGKPPWNKGKHLSEETKKKLSLSHNGEKNHMFGKRGEKSPWFGRHHSEESRKKMSISRSGEKNHMFGKHMSAETRKMVSDRKIGRKWFTNGVDEICRHECPGEGWVRGRTKTSKKTK